MCEPLHLHQHAPAPNVAHTAAAPRGRRKAVSRKSPARVSAAYRLRQTKAKISKRSGPLPEAKRQKTHAMRKTRATCTRCRFYKNGCDEGEVCQPCLKVLGNARSFMLPCTRDRLEDAHLVRHCNGRSNQDEGEFFPYDWLQGHRLYTIEMIWNLPGYGPISNNASPMRVSIRRYYPNKQLLDTTMSTWTNCEGDVEIVDQPAYAIYDTALFVPAFERYFSTMQPAIERWIFDRVRTDEIALLTYHEVMRVRSKQPSGTRNLLDLALRVQGLSVVSQGYGSITTPNIPDIREYDYGKMGRSIYEAYDRNSRDRPLTNAMNHQLDVAALKYLKKLEKLLQKELSTKMFQSKIKPWYEVFLALYVIFWNMEYISRGAKKYIMAKNGTAKQQVSSVVSNQLKKWEWASKVLTHHWQAVLRTFYPFKLARENPEELRMNGWVDAEGFAYVMRVVHIFDSIGFGRSTAPYIGTPSTHDSLSSDWIRGLFEKAFGM
ncbi:hypothetical protein K458DRAFT_290815 [Lentithecium fluviatile CBS 122367]|uniref:Zn(2)-C6 fungal-type domain-containing protein n=1 Tax=Lentithecium fluviatile CBS 122367 TaxID=1168545 RepID=A0A6G1JFG4_9PLEO|nr:hypothetical protein K458DRAFT_290815 [Lentithecium fluviatile CBS 122367]